MKKNSFGFSLIETLAVLAISATLMAIVVPNLTIFLAKARLEAETHLVLHTLFLARSEAIRQAAPVYVCPINVKQNLDIQGCAPKTTKVDDAWHNGLLIYSDNKTGKVAVYNTKESVGQFIFRDRASLPVLKIKISVRQFYFDYLGYLVDFPDKIITLNHASVDICNKIKINALGYASLVCEGTKNDCVCV
jgi:prepilin-type N-terminal cleavage/methylation domain-containing protein